MNNETIVEPIKIFAEKDIRNYSYISKISYIIFETEEDFDNFVDYINNLLSFFKNILICDILSYFGTDHEFEAAYQYGWDASDIVDAIDRYKDIPFTPNSIRITLPKPKYVIENHENFKGENK